MGSERSLGKGVLLLASTLGRQGAVQAGICPTRGEQGKFALCRSKTNPLDDLSAPRLACG